MAGNETGAAVDALRRGDISGLETLVHRYQAPALRLAVALTGDPHIAEDAVSDAFVTVHRSIQTFDRSRPFEPWFYRIMVNRVRRLLRRERQRRVVQGAWLNVFSSRSPLPEEAVLQQETNTVVRNAIRRLPLPQQEVLIMAYYLDMDTATIARIQAVPVGTVKWRLFQGRRRLQSLLVPTDVDTPAPEVLANEPRA